MKYILSFLFLFAESKAQHTSPLVNAGADVTCKFPVTPSVTGTVTYYNGASGTINWSKVKSPSQPNYIIVIVGSSTAAGFGVTTAEYFGTKLSSFYKPQGFIDSVYNAGENGGQTVFGANITSRLNIGGVTQNKIIILSYPSNGYNGSTYTNVQIMDRWRVWRDSIVNRGYQYLVLGTQPREDFSAGDRTRLNVLNDSLSNLFGNRFVNMMPIAKQSGNDLWKNELDNGDGVHGNGFYHTFLRDKIIAANPFQFIATGGTITTPSSATTTITGLSYAEHFFQLSSNDTEGHGNGDVIRVTYQPETFKYKFRLR